MLHRHQPAGRAAMGRGWLLPRDGPSPACIAVVEGAHPHDHSHGLRVCRGFYVSKKLSVAIECGAVVWCCGGARGGDSEEAAE